MMKRRLHIFFWFLPLVYIPSSLFVFAEEPPPVVKCDVKKEHGFSAFTVKFTDEYWMTFPRQTEDAEVRKCIEWPGFKGLFVVEATAGTIGKVTPRKKTFLYIIDTRSGKVKQRHKALLEDQKGKEMDSYPYTLSTSKNGKKAVLKMKGELTKSF